MSFIEVSPDSHFPIQNLPYGVFSTKDNVSFSHSLTDRFELNRLGSTKNWCGYRNENSRSIGD